MGYTTDFEGYFTVTPALNPNHLAYLQQFSGTRRMKRDATLCFQRADPIRLATGLGVGLEGGFFVGEKDFRGQGKGSDVLDYNNPPHGQPGLWCDWVPSEDGTRIEWGGSEKFYDYVEWISYLIVQFLQPWGYKLNGTVLWTGEDNTDIGTIQIVNNTINEDVGIHIPEDKSKPIVTITVTKQKQNVKTKKKTNLEWAIRYQSATTDRPVLFGPYKTRREARLRTKSDCPSGLVKILRLEF